MARRPGYGHEAQRTQLSMDRCRGFDRIPVATQPLDGTLGARPRSPAGRLPSPGDEMRPHPKPCGPGEEDRQRLLNRTGLFLDG